MSIDNGDTPSLPPALPAKTSRSIPRWVYALAAVGGSVGLVAWYELHSSGISSKPLEALAAGKISTTVETTRLCKNFAPAAGPIDDQRGYMYGAKICERVTIRGWEQISKDVEWQRRTVLGADLFTIYNEKAQAGFELRDMNGESVYKAVFPQNVYADFDAIPAEFLHALLFVENKELLGDHAKSLNPAIEWPRLLRATFGHFTGLGDGAGASTLATQLDKFRHSPDGITRGSREKLRQMLTASTRPYLNGPDTTQRRKEIALEYINGMPLAAVSTGVVHGLGDGLVLWMGEDFADANALMKKPESALNDAEMARKGEITRKGLSLIMSVTMPSDFLRDGSMVVGDQGTKIPGRAALDQRVQKYLPALRQAGILSERLYQAVLAAKVTYTVPEDHVRSRTRIEQKSVNMLRSDLSQLMNVKGGLYGLDHLDGSATVTIHGQVSKDINQFLRYAKTPQGASTIGLVGDKLLPSADTASRVDFAFTLYEITDKGNVLRVEEDTSDQPLNLNRHVKAGYGSTAKFRTFVDYLESVKFLHDRYQNQDADALKAIKLHPKDNLTRWALDYLADPATDKSLPAMQNAALDRRYSASPHETFFTSGGVHPPIANFDSKDNNSNPTVREALYRSINLPFIRIMRDIVYFTQSQKMQIDAEIFTDPANPQRREYLEKFVHSEGTQFMWRYWKQQSGKTPDELLTDLAAKTSRSPDQLTAVYRTLMPQASFADLRRYLLKECPKCTQDPAPGEDLTPEWSKKLEKQDQNFRAKYDEYAPGKFDINDLGYRARPIHPLELWLAQHKIANHTAAISALHQQYAALPAESLHALKLDDKDITARWVVDYLLEPKADKSLPAMQLAAQNAKMPDTGWKAAVEASAEARITSYKWLLDSNKFEGQNNRLHTILEKEAFVHIHKSWAKVGFPFEKMVPSLTSALGVSSDKPEALATLMGIIQNKGVWVDTNKYTDLKLAENTPYWKHYRPKPAQSRQAIDESTAALTRDALIGVVNFGTGRRMKDVIKLSDGTVLENGGKTGTDNQDYAVEPKRTMTFVTLIGQKHYAVITAIIHDPKPNEKPTSGLVVQLMKYMSPLLTPVLDQAYNVPTAIPEPGAPTTLEKLMAPPAAKNDNQPQRTPKPATLRR